MDKFQLEELDTEYLTQLRDQASAVLAERERHSRRDKRRQFIRSLTTEDYETLRTYNAKVNAWNASKLLALPHIDKRKKQNLAQFLPALLAQDWYHLYPRQNGRADFYVYAHVDPRKSVFVADKLSGGNYGGMPFYIGKGSGDRAFDLKRNQGHGKAIRQLLDEGYAPVEFVKILIEGLLESKAFEIEAKLIYFFGSIYQKRGKQDCLLNLDTPLIPEFVGIMEEAQRRDTWQQKIRISNPSLPHEPTASNSSANPGNHHHAVVDGPTNNGTQEG